MILLICLTFLFSYLIKFINKNYIFYFISYQFANYIINYYSLINYFILNLFAYFIYFLYDSYKFLLIINLITLSNFIEKFRFQYQHIQCIYILLFLFNSDIIFSTFIFKYVHDNFQWQSHKNLKMFLLFNAFAFNIYIKYNIFIQFIVFNIFFLINTYDLSFDLNYWSIYFKLLFYPENKLINYLDEIIYNYFTNYSVVYLEYYLKYLPNFKIIKQIQNKFENNKISDMIKIYPKYKNYIIYLYCLNNIPKYAKKYHMNYLTFYRLSWYLTKNKSKYFLKLYNIYINKQYKYYPIYNFSIKDYITYLLKRRCSGSWI